MKKNAAAITELRAALRAFSPEGPHFGEKERTESADTAVAEFRRNLQSVSTANRSYFILCVGFLVVAFVGACFLIFRFLDNPKGAAAVFGVTGLSFAGIIKLMTDLWRKKVSSDLLLVLAGQLRPADLKGISDVLLREYFK
jgi:hypothetical protein